ncbi:MAG: GNAT family N-acetyltransferase [Gammaproteobacteria bacterium]|nr:MAG: GNAT family N-acetyltransferase [Gammaproteobacteria bacterium]
MKIDVLVTHWNDAARRREIEQIRRRVFIEEQGVPEALEWDGDDAGAIHFLALADRQPAGCARLLADGRVGRMAVLPRWRGHGIGRRLLQRCEATARERGLSELRLSAQLQALDFYLRQGYEPVMDHVYLDAGIPHRDLRRSLEPSS